MLAKYSRTPSVIEKNEIAPNNIYITKYVYSAIGQSPCKYRVACKFTDIYEISWEISVAPRDIKITRCQQIIEVI